MVRLVFRPYTRVRRSICTLESLQASTRVSSGFTLLWHSSPSFGSHHAGYVVAAPQRGYDETMLRPVGSHLARITSHPPQGQTLLSLRLRVLLHPQTRLHDKLLGPCFKTGQVSGQPVTKQRRKKALRQACTTRVNPMLPSTAMQYQNNTSKLECTASPAKWLKPPQLWTAASIEEHVLFRALLKQTKPKQNIGCCST